jgi:hypothetical protein
VRAREDVAALVGQDAHGDSATIFRRATAVLKHNRAGVARLIGRETGSIVLKAC